MTARPPSFVFSSVAGYTLLRHTLRDRIPYCPHDYQLEGVCQLLDGNDLIAVLATGSGKTAYYLLYILMLVALSSDSSLCTPSFRVPTDPCIVIVYPTNGLEEEQVFMSTPPEPCDLTLTPYYRPRSLRGLELGHW